MQRRITLISNEEAWQATNWAMLRICWRKNARVEWSRTPRSRHWGWEEWTSVGLAKKTLDLNVQRVEKRYQQILKPVPEDMKESTSGGRSCELPERNHDQARPQCISMWGEVAAAKNRWQKSTSGGSKRNRRQQSNFFDVCGNQKMATLNRKQTPGQSKRWTTWPCKIQIGGTQAGSESWGGGSKTILRRPNLQKTIETPGFCNRQFGKQQSNRLSKVGHRLIWINKKIGIILQPNF